MKSLMLLFLTICTYHTVFAQITGRVIGADGMPLPGATIELRKASDSEFVKGVATDSFGNFEIAIPLNGLYLIKSSATGYEVYYSSPFKITEDSGSVHLDKIVMAPSIKGLQEVTISSTKALYQPQPGGITVNVQNSVMTKGSSVLAVLQQSPGVALDQRNNNLSLNGKSGVEVMLDGRLMNIPMDQLTRLLESMSADDIEKIELLTTPPANYEAEGNAGLINIVRKKNRRKGSNGTISLTAGYGQGGKSVVAAGLGVNKGSLNIDGNYIFSYNRSAFDLYGNSSQDFPPLGGKTEAYFHNDNQDAQFSQNISLRAGYSVNNKTRINMQVSLNQDNGNSKLINQRILRLLPDSVFYFDATIKGQANITNWIGSVDLEKKLRRNAEIRLELDFISFQSNYPTQAVNQFVNSEGGTAGFNDTLYSPLQRGYAKTSIRIGVFKADYKRIISKKLFFETGLKGSYTRNASRSGIESVVNEEWVSRPEASTDISLVEVLAAGYASVNADIGKDIKLVTGLRYEFSRTGKTDLSVFFPYLSVSKPHWQFSYSKRIGRPAYRDLSSFIIYNDPLSVFTGNPFLKPTITHNLNLAYDYHGYSASLLWSRDINPISRWQIVESPNRDLMYIGPQNLEWQNNFTLQLNAPVKIAKWWIVNLNVVGGWKQYREEYTKYPLQKTWFGYSGTASQTFQLPKNYSVEISGWYNSASYNGTTKTQGFGSVNGGIKKQLNKNSGTIQFSVTDIFSTTHYITSYGSLTQEAFNGSSHVVGTPESGISPIFRLSWSRSFGLQAAKSSGTRASGSNDEQERIK